MTREKTIKYTRRALAIVASTLLLSCGNREPRPTAELMVTIAPLKYIVEQITAGDFEVGVMVPTGASPETFDPTPRQMAEVSDAKLLFSTGLIDFENNLVERLEGKCEVVDLSHGVDLIEGHVHAHHADGEAHEAEHSHEGHNHDAEASHNEEQHTHAHHHGVDPHIWTSPRELKIMARNAYDAIIAHYPDSARYTEAYNALIEQLNALDEACQTMCAKSTSRAFAIYHPALSYYARAYGIEQIAIENEGKEPSARQIAQIIDKARATGVRTLLYQVEFPRSVVDIVAKDMGVEPTEINPLAENPVEFIESVTRLITGNNQ